MKCACYRTSCHVGHGIEPCPRPATVYGAWDTGAGVSMLPYCAACARCASSHDPLAESFVTTSPAILSPCDPVAFDAVRKMKEKSS